MGADTIISQVARPPSNLLDFVNTKALGRNPDELLEAVRPIIDLVPFIRSSSTQIRMVSGSDASGVTGICTTTGTHIVVPPDRTWVPLRWAMTAVPTAAGDVGRLKQCIVAPSSTVPLVPVWFSAEASYQAIVTTSLTAISLCTDFSSSPSFYGAGHYFVPWWDQNVGSGGGFTIVSTLSYLELGL